MEILVVGGAGFIGSHMVKLLADRGHGVVTLDNLTSGHADAVLGGEFIAGDCGNAKLLTSLFVQSRFDVVMHFAGCIEVGESFRDPARFYHNNVGNVLTLLQAVLAHGRPDFIFSSSAAVYGEPKQECLTEEHAKDPLSPYARSKWIIEQILSDYDRAYGLRSVSLRYFNAAGAHPDGILGERHCPETHLIPVVLRAAGSRSDSVAVFGSDYPTPDGTCIRDYVHVQDLCYAHLLAVEWIARERRTTAFNLGNGSGFSVREVIDVAQRVTGRPIRTSYGPRRAGDATRLVADATRATNLLGWVPRIPELAEIIGHAWQWQSRSDAVTVVAPAPPPTKPPRGSSANTSIRTMRRHPG